MSSRWCGAPHPALTLLVGVNRGLLTSLLSCTSLAQMSKITLAQLSSLAKVPEKDLTNWMQRLDLTTKYQKAKTGPATSGRFTRENAIELYLIAKLVRIGMSPAEAADAVAGLFAHWAYGAKPGLTAFIGDNIVLDDWLTADQLADLQREEGEEVAYIALDAAAAIVQVDKFFATVLEPVSDVTTP
jgi:hypothetical protein